MHYCDSDHLMFALILCFVLFLYCIHFPFFISWHCAEGRHHFEVWLLCFVRDTLAIRTLVTVVNFVFAFYGFCFLDFTFCILSHHLALFLLLLFIAASFMIDGECTSARSTSLVLVSILLLQFALKFIFLGQKCKCKASEMNRQNKRLWKTFCNVFLWRVFAIVLTDVTKLSCFDALLTFRCFKSNKVFQIVRGLFMFCL